MWYDCWTMGGISIISLLIIFSILFMFYGVISKDKVSSSLDTLKSRYARGEISKDEYDAIKKDIT